MSFSIRAFELVGVTRGNTVRIDGGAGGVGAVAVQIAFARGATVIASAGEGNQDYLREIRATPVLYGDGMVDRAGTSLRTVWTPSSMWRGSRRWLI